MTAVLLFQLSAVFGFGTPLVLFSYGAFTYQIASTLPLFFALLIGDQSENGIICIDFVDNLWILQIVGSKEWSRDGVYFLPVDTHKNYFH